MGTTFATKRMWLRRSRRVGLFLLPVLKLPFYPFIWAFQFYRAFFRSWRNTGSEMFCLGIVAHIIAAFGVFVYTWNWNLLRDATVEEISAARAADPYCFDNTIIRRAAEWKRPITNQDVKRTLRDCDKMWDELARKKAQQEAFESQPKR